MDNEKEMGFINNAIIEASKKSYEERKIAERKLAVQATEHLDVVASLLKSAEVPVRRLLVEILARMKPSPQAQNLLLQALFNDPDVKSRRRAAAALGSTGNKAVQAHLVSAFEQEEHRFVQASIILALGALGFEWTPSWSERIGRQGPVAEAYRKASARSEVPAGHAQRETGEYEVTRPAEAFMLECYPGIEQFVQTELGIHGVNGACWAESGWIYIDIIEAAEEKLKTLGEIRTVISTYAVAAEVPVGVTSLGDYLVDAYRKIKHTVDPQRGTLGFRLELPRMDSRAQYRKTIVKLARRITAETGWSNNPSHYTLDIRVVQINNLTYILWRDTRWRNPRHTEQRAVLPASIHPTVAASLCIAGNINFSDVFCDPCCGAGTIIAERLGFGPAKRVFGFDLSKEAISLSKQNLSRFSHIVDLRKADMRNLPLESKSLDIIIANLPFGIRTGDRSQNRSLYRDFLKESQRVLTSGGRVVAYTQDASAFELGCRDSGWQGVQRIASVRAGGLTVQVYKGVLP